jgi:hypothetical protein
MLLTQAERDKFAAWLENEARTDMGMVEQMATIGTPDMVLTRYRQEATAAMLIARKLRSIHDEVV